MARQYGLSGQNRGGGYVADVEDRDFCTAHGYLGHAAAVTNVSVTITGTSLDMAISCGDETVVGKAIVSATGNSAAISTNDVAVKTIFVGLTAGVVDGVLGSGGSLPTGWGSNKTSNVTMTVTGHGIDDSVEYIDVQYSATTAGTSNGNIYFPLGFAGTTPANIGENWKVEAYLKRTATSGGGINGQALSVHESDSGSSFLGTHDDSTALATAGAFQASYRSNTAALSNVGVARVNGALYIGLDAVSGAASGTVRMALKFGLTGTSVTVNATGNALAISTQSATVRLLPGNPLGSALLGNLASITNPMVTSANMAMVAVDDLIYAIITQETALTATAMSDNLGNTYTACNAGSDVGNITGRAFYSIVTTAGLLDTVSATTTASSNNCIILAQAFQGPFTSTPLDANPANVGSDITSPYLGPSTGTLTQSAELLVAWATRPDGVTLTAVSPLISITQAASASVIRTQLSYQVLAATTSVQPSWTSPSDPAQLLSGATTFKISTGAVDVSVDATGNSLAISVGDETVVGKAIVNADTNLATISTNDVIVTGKAIVSATTNSAAISVGDETIGAGVGVNATGNSLAISTQDVQVKTIFVGLTAGVTLGVVGSGGSLPTGWGSNKASNVTATIVGFGIDDSVEYFDVKMDATTLAGNSDFNMYFPLGFAGTTPASIGENWKVEAYLKVVATSGAGINGQALSIHESDSSSAFLGTHDDYTSIPTSGAYQASYRENAATLNQAGVARINGAIYIGQNATSAPSSATVRVATKLEKVGGGVSVDATGNALTASSGTVTPSGKARADAATNLITASSGTPTVQTGVAVSVTSLLTSGPIVTTANNQVIQNLDIVASGTHGIWVQHTSVVIRNCKIRHTGGHGIYGVSCADVAIDHCDIAHSAIPSSGAHASEQNNIYLTSANAAQVTNTKCVGGSTGIYIVNSTSPIVTNVQCDDMRGPYPRGQAVQFNNCANAILDGFSGVNSLTNSWPEDNINVYQSSGVQILNGLVDGSNAPNGVGVMFENSPNGTCRNVDAIHMGNGAFSTYFSLSTNVLFDSCRTRDGHNTGQGGRAAPSSNGATFTAAESATGNLVACKYFNPANAGNVLVEYNGGNFITEDYASLNFTAKSPLDIALPLLSISVGTVSVIAVPAGTAMAQGIALAATAGTVSTGTNAIVAAAGSSMTAGSGRGTVRLAFGNPLGPLLSQSLASITNPFVASNVAVEVQYGDLIYVVITEQTNLTTTAVVDNLGHTYTALNAGSDSGAVTSRAFYTLVATPGMLTSVSASTTSTSDNAVMLVQAFQGSFTPLTPLDASPSNSVNLDIVSPYVGPSTGTLAQADELLVAWISRPDSVTMTAVAPLLAAGQINSATVLRTNLSYQVLSATTTIAPSWTAATDPTQTIMGASTFKKNVGGGTSVSVNALGSEATIIVGTATVTAAQTISVNAATNLITASTHDVAAVTGTANVNAASNLLTMTAGNIVFPAVNVSVNATGNSLAISTSNVSVGTIYLGLTAGVTDGIVGAGGSLPTGWRGDTLGVQLTVAGHGYDDGVEYFDLTIDGISGIQHYVELFYPNGYVGVPATDGQTWRSGAYLKLMSGSLVATELDLAGVSGGFNWEESYRNTTPPASSGAYQLSYREVVQTLLDNFTTTATGYLYFQLSFPASATIRIAAKLSSSAVSAGVTTPPALSITAGTVSVLIPKSVDAASQFALISTNDVLVRAGVGAAAQTNLLTMTAGTIPSVTGKAFVSPTSDQLTMTAGNPTIVGKAIVTTTGTSLGMTMSTSTPTVGGSVTATITAMPAMTIATALPGAVTAGGVAVVEVIGIQLTISIGGQSYVPTVSLPYQREGRMVTMANLMGS